MLFFLQILITVHSGGLEEEPFIEKGCDAVSNDRGSKSLSWSRSFKRRFSNFVPTAGMLSKVLGGTGGANKI